MNGGEDQALKLEQPPTGAVDNFKASANVSRQPSDSSTDTPDTTGGDYDDLVNDNNSSDTIDNALSKAEQDKKDEAATKRLIETAPEFSIVENTANYIADRRDTVPDIKELTIRNLDTGEEFIIGENDPDFEFDTFEIRGDLAVTGAGTAGSGSGGDKTPNDTVLVEETNNDKNKKDKKDNKAVGAGTEDGKSPGGGGGGNKTTTTPGSRAPEQQQEENNTAWWKGIFNFIYRRSNAAKQKEEQERLEKETAASRKARTPFTKLSSFKFRKELGRGAFGRVLLAEARIDGKLYALKIITKKNMRTSDKRQAKAERDILHAMALKSPHPFTSGLKFAFQSENNLYLGMDFIPGGNLRELIKRFKHLPEEWVRFYAAELVLAISHLHSLNVLYRDIKPHNVMIDARGHLILIDFGLSKQEISHPKGALSLVGTPDYSAPEVLKTGVQQIEAHNREKQARKAGMKVAKEPVVVPKSIGYGKAADWWSLGIMIYEMLSGTPTFRGTDLRQTYQRILYADLEFVPEERFSLSSRVLLAGMISRDPTTRLGAWENPPADIMNSAFFAGVEWDAIFERRFDGPWIPDTSMYMSNSVPAGAAGSALTGSMRMAPGTAGTTKPTVAGGAATSAVTDALSGNGGASMPPRKVAKSPQTADGAGGAVAMKEDADADLAGFDHNNADKTRLASTANKAESAAAAAARAGVTAAKAAAAVGEEEEDEDGEEDEEDDEEEGGEEEDKFESKGKASSGLLNLRDSVFNLSACNPENKLEGWSFMDEGVLINTKDEKKKKKKRKKGPKTGVPTTTDVESEGGVPTMTTAATSTTTTTSAATTTVTNAQTLDEDTITAPPSGVAGDTDI